LELDAGLEVREIFRVKVANALDELLAESSIGIFAL
jgi:hypothetical protein